MADQDTERQSAQQEAPGGGLSRGPEYGTGGGEVQADVPPYDDQRGEPSGEGAEGVRKAFDAATYAPEPDSAPPVSKEEREGMSSTDMDPEPALGVGVSSGGRAEDLAPDRPDVDTKAGRPVGKVAGGDSKSAQDTRDPESPDLQAGGG